MNSTAELKANTCVLIVDDDEFMQDVFEAMFESLGAHEVHTASDGRSALRKLKQLHKPPDVLLCDVFMPNMDGFEFLEHLARMKFQGHILFVTGVDSTLLDTAVLIAQSEGLRVLGRASKPLSRDELIIALGRAQKIQP